MMIRLCALLIFVAVIGCGIFEPAANKPFVPPKGMKISDLEPAATAPKVQPLEFQIYIYEFPVAKIPGFRDLLETLDHTGVEVRDATALTNNSVSAAYGKPKIGPQTVRRLEDLGGQQMVVRALIIFDEQGDDLSNVELPQKAEIAWRDGTGLERRTEFGAGRLSWILKAKPVAESRGLVEVRIEPGFRKKVDELGGRMLGRTDIPVRGFPFMAFTTRMSPGDFLLFGPNQTPGNTDTLSGLLCRSSRNPLDHVLIYLVICSRVAN